MIRLCALAPAGSDGLCLCVRLRLWGTGLTFPAGTTEAEAEALGRRYRAAGVRIVQVEEEKDLTEPTAVQSLRRALRLAAAADALSVVTGAGRGDAARLDDVARTIRAILGVTPARVPVRLLLETRGATPLSSLLAASEAVRRVAHPAFGILFDPVGLLNIDTYFDNGSFLRRSVQQLGSALGLVHARDALLHPGGFDFRLSIEPVGSGALDYAALLQALSAMPGDVPLCVEGAASEAEVAAAVEHLRNLAGRIGVELG